MKHLSILSLLILLLVGCSHQPQVISENGLDCEFYDSHAICRKMRGNER